MIHHIVYHADFCFAIYIVYFIYSEFYSAFLWIIKFNEQKFTNKWIEIHFFLETLGKTWYMHSLEMTLNYLTSPFLHPKNL